jgi:hypothetical protein
MRSRVEVLRETTLEAQVTTCDSKQQLDATRAECIRLERELTRNGIEIKERLAAEEARWYTSTRLRDFTTRFQRIFASGQAV